MACGMPVPFVEDTSSGDRRLPPPGKVALPLAAEKMKSFGEPIRPLPLLAVIVAPEPEAMTAGASPLSCKPNALT